MSDDDTFEIRLLGGSPDDRFVYYDHTELQAGDAEREVTPEWTDHDLEDLDRIMAMLDWQGYRFEVRGLVHVSTGPGTNGWAIDLHAGLPTSPRAIYEAEMAQLQPASADE